LGFVLVISAAFFSGFRWALTQILLLRNPATSNPFASIFYLAPVMFGTLLLIALPVEGPSQLLEGLRELVAKKGPFLGPGIMLAPGVLAFCMTAAEFALLQRTSVVTLSIAGIFKEVVTIFTAGQVFDDTMTTINFIGLAITISAIAGYNYMKVRKMREEAQVQAHLAHLGIAGEEGRGHMHRHEHTAAEEHTDDEERRKGKGVEQQGLLGPRGGSRSVSPRASSPR
jgi:solute carrier family 35 protein C2